LNPKEARAYYGLGNTFFDQQRYDDALAAYKEATRLKSDYAEAFNLIWLAYRTIETIRTTDPRIPPPRAASDRASSSIH